MRIKSSVGKYQNLVTFHVYFIHLVPTSTLISISIQVGRILDFISCLFFVDIRDFTASFTVTILQETHSTQMNLKKAQNVKAKLEQIL